MTGHPRALHVSGMATLTVEGDELVLRLSSMEKLGALRGDVRLPLADVEGVAVSEAPFRELRGIRAPGTGWPGKIALGTWRYRGGRDFAALRGGQPGVIVSLRDGPFRRLLVSAGDAQGLAQQIRG